MQSSRHSFLCHPAYALMLFALTYIKVIQAETPLTFIFRYSLIKFISKLKTQYLQQDTENSSYNACLWLSTSICEIFPRYGHYLSDTVIIKPPGMIDRKALFQKKNWGQKYAKFGVISDPFSLWAWISPERTKISKIKKLVDRQHFLSRWTKKVWRTLVH